MTTINRDELAYMTKMMELADDGTIREYHYCPECEISLHDVDLRAGITPSKFADQHLIIESWWGKIVIIGCEGFYIFCRDGKLRSTEG